MLYYRRKIILAILEVFGGQLTAKFGIRHTPAVVTGAPISNGVKALKVSEVPLGPKGRPS